MAPRGKLNAALQGGRPGRVGFRLSGIHYMGTCWQIKIN